MKVHRTIVGAAVVIAIAALFADIAVLYMKNSNLKKQLASMVSISRQDDKSIKELFTLSLKPDDFTFAGMQTAEGAISAFISPSVCQACVESLLMYLSEHPSLKDKVRFYVSEEASFPVSNFRSFGIENYSSFPGGIMEEIQQVVLAARGLNGGLTAWGYSEGMDGALDLFVKRVFPKLDESLEEWVFPEFEDGSFKMKDKPERTGKMNINLMSRSLWIMEDGRPVEVKPVENIERVVINGQEFVRLRDMFISKVDEVGGVVLYRFVFTAARRKGPAENNEYEYSHQPVYYLGRRGKIFPFSAEKLASLLPEYSGMINNSVLDSNDDSIPELFRMMRKGQTQ
jgi:hypothetical protein